MKRKSVFAVLFAGAVLISSPHISNADELKVPGAKSPEESAGKAPEEEGVRTYVIVKHDTLWDISKRFLRNPFKWPRIWKLNPYIKNPDLIYPGDTVKIMAVEEEAAGKKESEAGKKEAEARPLPIVELKPEEAKEKVVVLEPETPEAAPAVKEEAPKEAQAPAPIPVKPGIHGGKFMERQGIIATAEIEESGAIIGAKENKMLFNKGENVYVSFKDNRAVKTGDRFTIFTVGETILHPVNKKTLGNIIDVHGVLVVTKTGSAAEARIDESFTEIEAGYKLRPFKEFPGDVEITKADADISGYIVASLENKQYFAKGDFVYIDKGARDGIKKGNLMRIYRKGEEAIDPLTRKEIELPFQDLGSLVVLEPGEYTSVCIITKSLTTINRGDIVSTRQAD